MTARKRGGSTPGSRPNNGGKREPGPGKKLGPPRQRFRLATPEEARAFEQLAADLGFQDGQALLIGLVERYDEQPGLVRNALREALFSASEIAVYRACVEEMLAERDAPDLKDFIL